MGARRDDITGTERAQIAIETLSRHRPRGVVTRMAREYGVTRETIYNIGDKGREVLATGLAPGPHGPQPVEKAILVDRNRLVRGVVVLSEKGVSQRGVSLCLEELLDTRMSPGWVNVELAKVEEAATIQNERWQPAVNETLSGDEIYSNDCPNLLVVGNDSLYIYALTRQPTCDGDMWGSVLLEMPDCPQFASDGGTGLAAGAKVAEMGHQLDWDHLLRPMWGQVSRLERQAYAALKAMEERVAKFDRAHTPKRLEQHLAAWERLSAEAEEKIARHDAFLHVARQVDAWFALIDLESGQLRDPITGAQALHRVGEQLREWKGCVYKQLSRHLDSFAEGLFYYQPVLTQALAPWVEQWGEQAIQALSRIWQIEADEKRHPLPLVEQQARHKLWEESLNEAIALLGEELWKAWDALSSVLGRSWRGSMLAECVNSLLRPILDGRQYTDQGCLELFRLLHNVRPFERGKRAGHSPAQLVGLHVPDDPLTLLGLAPKGETTRNSHTLAAGTDPLTVAQAFGLSPDVETNSPCISMVLPHYTLEGQEVSI